MANRIKVRLIMQLHDSWMKQDEIAATRHMSRSSISTVLRIARDKNITYKDIIRMDDDTVYKLFFPDKQLTEDIYELPDYGYVHEQLKQIGVTEKMLWEEYRDGCLRKGTITLIVKVVVSKTSNFWLRLIRAFGGRIISAPI